MNRKTAADKKPMLQFLGMTKVKKAEISSAKNRSGGVHQGTASY
jgi:hypothetical protein